MTKELAKEIDFFINAAFNLPAPEMPIIFDEKIIELTDEDMEYLSAAKKHNSYKRKKANKARHNPKDL